METEHATPPSEKLVQFGKYLLLERVAVGGMAEVWLAKRVTPEGASDLIALKRILPHLSADAEFIRMFVDEARIAGQLQHPGIVPTQELGRIGPSFYIAMEFVWGRDLLQLLRHVKQLGQKIDPVFCAYIGSKLCDALHYAHTKHDKSGKPLQLVHRDVSPQNVLVSFEGGVKLIDFGIAKAASRSAATQVGTLKGKVGYMSPEAVRGVEVDARSDLFAVGVLLYEMLTVRPLFARGNNIEAMNRVRDADVPPLRKKVPSCPEALADAIMRALSLKPEDRFQDANEMRLALDAFLATQRPCSSESIAAWLHEIYESDYSREKSRITALDAIGRVHASDATLADDATPEALPDPRNATPAVPMTRTRTSQPPDARPSRPDVTRPSQPVPTRPSRPKLDQLAVPKRGPTLSVPPPPMNEKRSSRPGGDAKDSPAEVFFQRDEVVRVGEPNPESERVSRPLKGLFRPGRANAVDTFRAPLVSRTGDSQRPPAMQPTSRTTGPLPKPVSREPMPVHRETLPGGGVGTRPVHASIGDSYEEESTTRGTAIQSTHSMTHAGREPLRESTPPIKPKGAVVAREVAGLPSFTVQRGKPQRAAESDDDDETFDDIGARQPLVPPSVNAKTTAPSVPLRNHEDVPEVPSRPSKPEPMQAPLSRVPTPAPPAPAPMPAVNISAPIPSGYTPPSSAITQALEAMALEPKAGRDERPSGFVLDANALDAQVIETILPQVARSTEGTREPTEAFKQEARQLTSLRARYSGADLLFFAALLLLVLALGGVFSLAWAEATRGAHGATTTVGTIAT